MRVSRAALARVLIMTVVVSAITPSFCAYAVENESNRADESSKIEDERDDDKGSTVSRAARMKSACAKVRSSISNRTASLQQKNERHLSVIDKVYDNVTAFASNNALVISDSDKQIVANARAAAKAAILDVAHSEDALNCEDSNVGQSAATLRLAIQAVNDTMHNYRKAVGATLDSVKAQSAKGVLQ